MKRWMGILLALLLACLAATACAAQAEDDGELPGDVFEDGWVCGRASIDIDREGDAYRVEIDWGDSAAVTHEWRYSCAYDAGTDALVGTGEKHIVTYGGDGEVREDETVYTDGGVTFTLDGEGRLLWADAAENAGEGMAFERVEPEGDEDDDDDAPDPEGLVYVGEWACGDVTVSIDAEDGGYAANVRWPASAAEVVEWVYACDVDEGSLVGYPGEKYLIACNDAGLEVSSEEVYDDGMAVFALDSDGHLTWQDRVEDAGRDMVFEKIG